MGLWSSVIVVSIFSVLVIVADEWMHARRRKRKSSSTGGARASPAL
jgi:hypothetical protein